MRERSRQQSIAAREIAGATTFEATPRVATVFTDAAAFASEFRIASPSVAAAIHAALSGQFSFVALLGHRKAGAVSVLADVRRELETNAGLLATFPEVCYPLRKMEGIGQRRLLWRGEPIGAELHPDLIRLPIRPANLAAGCRIVAIKITPEWIGPQRLPAFMDDSRPHFEIRV